MSYSQYFPQRLFVLLRKNWDTMFYARGDDGLSIEEVSEGAPLLATAPKDDLYETNPRTWRRYMQVQMKIPRVQTITGVLLGLKFLKTKNFQQAWVGRKSSCIEKNFGEMLENLMEALNNLLHPDWGMAVSPFRRLLRAEYADGVSLPRVSVTGEPLPNARYLSNELYTHHSRPRSNHTILTLYFGLFIDHDIIRITSKTGHKGAAISCCHPEIIENPSYLHPECMAIGVPEDDPFYGPLGVRCLDFVRSAPAPGDLPRRKRTDEYRQFLLRCIWSGIDLLLRGLVREKSQSVDSFITDEVRNRLFQPHNENHLPGAMVGPVHACLIARQFNHLRYGDRFWFEAQNQSGSFTPGQLEQIYKSSFARILCDNSDRIEEIQRWALTAISPENPVVPCPEIPKVDLKVWTES
ncbi:Peroxidase like protein [Argiope bruennichi]|nr:Peroxidase like protein [Argiope bruennichi]